MKWQLSPLQMRKKYSVHKMGTCIFAVPKKWRVVRVVEGARLESVYTRKGIKSSNLLLSAENISC